MKVIKSVALGLLFAGMVSCNNGGQAQRKTALKTSQDSLSYALGEYIGLNFNIENDFPDLDLETFNQAIQEASDTAMVLLKRDEIGKILQSHVQKLAEKKNNVAKVEGEKFLADNKTKEGVVVTESGLQYVVLTEGSGDKPTVESTVKVHYHGTTPEGKVFDSSVDRGEPAQFPLNGVIKGWTEGLQLMTVGSKYKLFIPQELAYGANPRPGGPIKPFMPLVFEIELLDIVK